MQDNIFLFFSVGGIQNKAFVCDRAELDSVYSVSQINFWIKKSAETG